MTQLQKEKCVFAATEVELLGFCMHKNGVHPTTVKAGGTGIPWTSEQQFWNHCTDCCMTWTWTAVNDVAYRQAKELLQAYRVLAHNDNRKPLLLLSDALPYGVGALLNYMKPDGQVVSICFSSRTLTPTERNYGSLKRRH